MSTARVGLKMRCLVVGLIICCAALSTSAGAGGGPETTLLVVNRDSPLSMAVANTYIALRDLPERQVLWLEDLPPADVIDLAGFRTRVLAPIRDHLEASGLREEIDLIVYSAGFPYAVDFGSDIRAHGLGRDARRGTAGSLTGMTFFGEQIAAGALDYLGLRTNPYFRRPQAVAVGERAETGATVRFEPTRGFRNRYRWDWERGLAHAVSGERADHRHRLSVMLGYTGVRGNSVPEIEAYLERAAASDGTHPAGTVYLMENRDVRSRTRQPLFEPALADLAARGRRGEVLASGQDGQNGREPLRRRDVIGLVAGTRTFDWPGSGSVLLPGAIAESLTSYAGHFNNSAQTKLSEFLRHGAAGSSGAVREPYSFVEKFPVPQMHVYYADGASLAEAFYQSVFGPYQLLVVGDPLARPFAHLGEVALGFPDASGVWRGQVEVLPEVRPPAGRLVERVELWVNGRPWGSAPPRQSIALDTTRLPDGVNEVRLVAVEASLVETRYYGSWQVMVGNRGRAVDVEVAGEVAYGEPLGVSGHAEGANALALWQGSRQVAAAPVEGGRWSLTADSATLGMGPVRLVAVARYPDGGEARSKPLRVEVMPPRELIQAGRMPGASGGVEAMDAADAPEATGFGLELVVERRDQDGPLRLIAGGVGEDVPRGRGTTRIRYSGAFETRASGLYELTLLAEGQVSFSVGDAFHHRESVPAGREGLRLALPLEAGWHRFELTIEEPVGRHLRATLSGPEVAFALAGERVRP